jgi:hypothetical protein
MALDNPSDYLALLAARFASSNGASKITWLWAISGVLWAASAASCSPANIRQAYLGVDSVGLNQALARGLLTSIRNVMIAEPGAEFSMQTMQAWISL